MAVPFFLAGVLLLLVGLGSLGVGFLMREPPLPDGFTWKPPLEQVNNRDLNPATVLLPLTGIPAADALNAALDSGHWENAYALVAYDGSVAEPVRIGAFLQLGIRYAAARDESKAASCYLAAARIATLSPLVSDAVRQETYLQVAAGLRAILALDAARLATDQAFLIGQYSPVLRRDPPSRRLNQIANAYTALGAETLAAQARKLNDPGANPGDEERGLPRDPFVVEAGALPADAEITAAQLTRVAAAKQLVNDVRDVAPNRAADWPRDAVAQLQDALVSEDEIRGTYYARQRAQVTDTGVQIAIGRDKVNWYGFKYRVARGAFGADLVPAWSKDAAAIGEAWSQAWGELFQLYEAKANAIPKSDAVSQALEDVTRQELFAVRWGWYRGVFDTDLHATLAQLTGQLHDAAVASLRLDLVTVKGRTTDLLVPDELYGQNDQALPK